MAARNAPVVPRAPVGLGRAGKAQWSSIAGLYKLRADELAVLEDVSRTADMIAALTAAWAKDGSPMTTNGSMGQLVTHPLISELRQHRSARAALLKQLKLPDPEEGAAGAGRPNQHREAAAAKWSQRGA